MLANDTDVDGDTLDARVVHAAGGGQGPSPRSVLARSATRPRPAFTGVATFDYVVSDGNGGVGHRHGQRSRSRRGSRSSTPPSPRATAVSSTLVFTVQLTGASTTAVSATLTTANGTATAGADYEATTGTVTIPPGTLSVTVPVQVFGDLLDEPDETFTATLSAPSGATIGDGTATGTIVDDDPPPSLSVNDVSIVEGNLGTTAMEFKVALSSASAKTICGRVCDGGHRRDRRRRLPDG